MARQPRVRWVQEHKNLALRSHRERIAILDAERDWVQQFHFGATRNNNRHLQLRIGLTSGWQKPIEIMPWNMSAMA